MYTCSYFLSFMLLNWKLIRISNSGTIKSKTFLPLYFSYIISALYYAEQNINNVGCNNIVPSFIIFFVFFLYVPNWHRPRIIKNLEEEVQCTIVRL